MHRRRLLTALVASCGLVWAGAAAAPLKIPAPLPPADWQPRAEVRAYARGRARIVRDFVWGETLQPASGQLRLHVVDNTWEEGPESQDELREVVTRVRVPTDRAEYYIKFKELITAGERRPTMGGVLVNHEIFGGTGIGGPGLFPRLQAYAAVWGRANVLKNGRVIGWNRTALAWVGEAARDPQGRWLYAADHRRVTAHLVVFGSLGTASR